MPRPWLPMERHPDQKKALSRALRNLMNEHNLSIGDLIAAVEPGERKRKYSRVWNWASGKKLPHNRASLNFLEKVEKRFELPPGQFRALIRKEHSASQALIAAASAWDKAAVRYHLPENFDAMSADEQAAVVDWLKMNILPCSTAYGKFMSTASRQRYAMIFPTVIEAVAGKSKESAAEVKYYRRRIGTKGFISAPEHLASEMQAFIDFKTALLPPIGLRRYNRWSTGTVCYYIRRYGEIFGALAAPPDSPSQGLGVPLNKLTLGLLAFPSVWEWFLTWRERRRGFITQSERATLYEAKSATRYPTGWVRQNPQLATRLRPIRGLITKEDIAEAKNDWASLCSKTFYYSCDALAGIRSAQREHRDTFLPILSVVSAKRPLNEYKKICDEILRRMPKSGPATIGVSVRAYLMTRFAIHLGFRQRNLRELLFCAKGSLHQTPHQLQDAKRGELRWHEEDGTWRVFAPAAAFKNSNSNYFKGRPYHTVLPDLDDLYFWIDKYINDCRPALLKQFADPKTFFVRDVDAKTKSAAFDACGYNDTWVAIIKQYGIYNPFTKRGAIEGLLPHGPHCVRDVLATHVLKLTGSYELAGFAIQDSAVSVMKHYARFMPHEKAERVAEVINEIWR